MELKFEKLDKEIKADFIEEMELLTVFLNNYLDVRLKWLGELEMTTSEMMRIDKLADSYAKMKVEIENKLMPKTREEVIKIEDEVLKKIYVGKILKIHNVNNPRTIAEFIIRGEYRDSTIIFPEQLEKLEKIAMFAEHNKKFPMGFLIFDSDNLKIIGIEVISV